MSCLELLDEWFESEPLRGVLAGVAVQGGAHGPMATGTALNLFRRATESGSGNPVALIRPRGGVGRLSEALASAARGAGAEIRLESRVKHVLLNAGQAAGVALEDGTEISARTVASGAGPGVTLLGLSDPAALDPEFVRALEAIRYRGATAKVHLALGELPRFEGLEDPEAAPRWRDFDQPQPAARRTCVGRRQVWLGIGSPVPRSGHSHRGRTGSGPGGEACHVGAGAVRAVSPA